MAMKHYNPDGTEARHFQKAPWAKSGYSLPTPERVDDTHYLVPSFSEIERNKGIKYMVDHVGSEWCCHCGWCVKRGEQYVCKHVHRVVDWLFEQELVEAIPQLSPVLIAVQRSRANGDNLVSIFDYSSAPTHKPTNRNHVQQFPSGAISFASARPTHGRVSAGELPVICERCSHENAPGTLYCEVCRQYVAEASLSYSA